jgi:hypothetical protein
MDVRMAGRLNIQLDGRWIDRGANKCMDGQTDGLGMDTSDKIDG